MRIGQANIDFDALTIHGLEGQFNMESKVMRVLEVLVENAGQVLTRPDLIEAVWGVEYGGDERLSCLLYTSPSPRDGLLSRMPSSA